MWGQTFNNDRRDTDNNLLEVFSQKRSGVPGTLTLSESAVKLIAPAGYSGWNPSNLPHTLLSFILPLSLYEHSRVIVFLPACVLNLKEAGEAWRKWSQDDHISCPKPWLLSLLIFYLHLMEALFGVGTERTFRGSCQQCLRVQSSVPHSGFCLMHAAATAAAKSLQSCPTLCDPMDCSLPGFSVHGILQARTLEWVATFFSSAWKWKVKVKLLSHVWLLAAPWTAAYQAPPSMGFSGQQYWSGVPLPSPCLMHGSPKSNHLTGWPWPEAVGAGWLKQKSRCWLTWHTGNKDHLLILNVFSFTALRVNGSVCEFAQTIFWCLHHVLFSISMREDRRNYQILNAATPCLQLGRKTKLTESVLWISFIQA